MCLIVFMVGLFLRNLNFDAEAISHPLINRLSFALSSGMACIISSSLTRVLNCKLEADAEMRNCLVKWVNNNIKMCYECLVYCRLFARFVCFACKRAA